MWLKMHPQERLVTLAPVSAIRSSTARTPLSVLYPGGERRQAVKHADTPSPMSLEIMNDSGPRLQIWYTTPAGDGR